MSTSMSAENLSRRRKDAKELTQSYITCSSEQQQEIEEEWDAADRKIRSLRTHMKNCTTQKMITIRADTGSPRSIGQTDLSQPWLCEETNPFTERIRNFEGEPTEAFMKRFKAESMHVSGSPECMTISRFMHEVAAADQSKKKVPPAWKHHETSHRLNFDKRLDFKSQHKLSRRQDRFTPLTKTPKEILAMETVKFKAP
ncbi:hypothetical protein Tco_1000684 [Tanacetum coccineum]